MIQRQPDTIGGLPNWLENTLIAIGSLLGTLLLGMLAWFGHTLWSVSNDVSAMKSDVTNTQSRIERIATALPEVRAKIAYEILHERNDEIVIQYTIEASKQNRMLVINPSDGSASILAFAGLTGIPPAMVQSTVSGIVAEQSESATSMKGVRDAARDLNVELNPAIYGTLDGSWVAMGSRGRIKKKLLESGFQELSKSKWEGGRTPAEILSGNKIDELIGAASQ